MHTNTLEKNSHLHLLAVANDWEGRWRSPAPLLYVFRLPQLAKSGPLEDPAPKPFYFQIRFTLKLVSCRLASFLPVISDQPKSVWDLFIFPSRY